MPVSESRLSYDDCFTLFEKALEDSKGARYQIAATPKEYGKHQYFRMRMHQARALDRKDNRDLYEPGHKLYGRSAYDPLVIQLKPDSEGGWWVYVSHTEINPEDIEALSEVEAEAGGAEA